MCLTWELLIEDPKRCSLINLESAKVNGCLETGRQVQGGEWEVEKDWLHLF